MAITKREVSLAEWFDLYYSDEIDKPIGPVLHQGKNKLIGLTRVGAFKEDRGYVVVWCEV